MGTVADVTAMIEKNEAAYRKVAEQSLALSRFADQQWAALGESMHRSLPVYYQQWANAGRQALAAADINRMIDPSIFSVAARMQETFAASSLARLDAQITETARRAMQTYDIAAWQTRLAADISRWPLARFESCIGAYLEYIDDIPRRLGADVLASLNAFNQRQWEILQAAVLPRMDEIFARAIAAGSVDDLVLDHFVEDEVGRAESDDDPKTSPQVLTRFQVIVIAYIMTLATCFFSLGQGGLTREQLQQDIHFFAVGVLGALTILLLNPPKEN